MTQRWQSIYNQAMTNDKPASGMAQVLYDACIMAGILIRTNDPTAALVHLDRVVSAYENQTEGELTK